tara:strand:- start:3845 stop:4027 length:183 start_codon:yes stop_codon:yes gene_type:complete
MNKTEDPNYSQKAKQIGENVIKKSKAAENYTQTGIQYLEVFISKLLTIKPKNLDNEKKRG